MAAISSSVCSSVFIPSIDQRWTIESHEFYEKMFKAHPHHILLINFIQEMNKFPPGWNNVSLEDCDVKKQSERAFHLYLLQIAYHTLHESLIFDHESPTSFSQSQIELFLQNLKKIPQEWRNLFPDYALSIDHLSLDAPSLHCVNFLAANALFSLKSFIKKLSLNSSTIDFLRSKQPVNPLYVLRQWLTLDPCMGRRYNQKLDESEINPDVIRLLQHLSLILSLTNRYLLHPNQIACKFNYYKWMTTRILSAQQVKLDGILVEYVRQHILCLVPSLPKASLMVPLAPVDAFQSMGIMCFAIPHIGKCHLARASHLNAYLLKFATHFDPTLGHLVHIEKIKRAICACELPLFESYLHQAPLLFKQLVNKRFEQFCQEILDYPNPFLKVFLDYLNQECQKGLDQINTFIAKLIHAQARYSPDKLANQILNTIDNLPPFKLSVSSFDIFLKNQKFLYDLVEELKSHLQTYPSITWDQLVKTAIQKLHPGTEKQDGIIARLLSLPIPSHITCDGQGVPEVNIQNILKALDHWFQRDISFLMNHWKKMTAPLNCRESSLLETIRIFLDSCIEGDANYYYRLFYFAASLDFFELKEEAALFYVSITATTSEAFLQKLGCVEKVGERAVG